MPTARAAGFLAAMRPVLAAAPPGEIGVAVSGGSDSVALMLLLADWAGAAGRMLSAITVDHGLRPGSAAEAAAVADLARGMGIAHETARWTGWDGQGNLQDRARAARRDLIAHWAARRGIGAVALGHTLEDQAETFLMRLIRGSGVDGLSAMAGVASGDGVLWLRPMLTLRRADLRALLAEAGVPWADDPSNADLRFDRVRLRQAAPLLADIGLWPERLAATADRMALAREALGHYAERLAREAAKASAAGYVRLCPAAMADAPLETQLRVLAHAIQWVTGAPYRPRLGALRALLAAIHAPGFRARTLHGALIVPDLGAVTVCREPARVGGAVPAGAVWDGRWRTAGPPGTKVAALGEAGLAACGDWRETGHPRAALLGTPGFYRNGALFAAPFAMPSKECHSALISGPDEFFERLRGR